MWLDYSKATQYYLLLMHLLLFSFATQIRLFFISSIFSLVITCHIQIQHLTFSGSPKIAVCLNTPTFSHLTKKKKSLVDYLFLFLFAYSYVQREAVRAFLLIFSSTIQATLDIPRRTEFLPAIGKTKLCIGQSLGAPGQLLIHLQFLQQSHRWITYLMGEV